MQYAEVPLEEQAEGERTRRLIARAEAAAERERVVGEGVGRLAEEYMRESRRAVGAIDLGELSAQNRIVSALSARAQAQTAAAATTGPATAAAHNNESQGGGGPRASASAVEELDGQKEDSDDGDGDGWGASAEAVTSLVAHGTRPAAATAGVLCPAGSEDDGEVEGEQEVAVEEEQEEVEEEVEAAVEEDQEEPDEDESDEDDSDEDGAIEDGAEAREPLSPRAVRRAERRAARRRARLVQESLAIYKARLQQEDAERARARQSGVDDGIGQPTGLARSAVAQLWDVVAPAPDAAARGHARVEAAESTSGAQPSPSSSSLSSAATTTWLQRTLQVAHGEAQAGAVAMKTQWGGEPALSPPAVWWQRALPI